MKKCEICNNPLPKRFRRFCSTKCRNRSYTIKFAEYRKNWQANKRGSFADNKIQCLICGKWYRQVGSHIVQIHKMTAREYREHFDLEVKKGILPPDLKEFMGKQAMENGTYKNLKVGKKYWFKKGDKTLGKYHRSHITIERLRSRGKTY